MPYLETPDELAEDIADMCGVYGSSPEDNTHPEDCKCRICFTIGIAERIRQSVQNEFKLRGREER